MYFIAFLCPPLAILLCGKPFQAIFCIPFCLFLFPGWLWAVLVVSDHKANGRHREAMYVARNQAANIAKLGNIQIAALKLQQKADRRAELADVPVLPMPAAPAAGQLPPSRATPAPAQLPMPEDEPKKPLFSRARIAEAIEGLKSARSGAVRAYHELPEWAQPITWGLGAGSCLSAAGLLLVLFRR